MDPISKVRTIQVIRPRMVLQEKFMYYFLSCWRCYLHIMSNLKALLVYGRAEFCYKVNHGLGFDASSRNILDVIFRELHLLWYYSFSQVGFLQDLLDETFGFYQDPVSLKLCHEFCSLYNNDQPQFLNFLIVSLGAFEHLTYKIHRSLWLFYFLDED